LHASCRQTQLVKSLVKGIIFVAVGFEDAYV